MSCRSFFPIFSIILSALSLASAWAKAPAKPTDFKVTPVGVNSFKVEWKDNSKNEIGFELRVGLKSKNPPPRFNLNPVGNPLTTDQKTLVITTNPLPGKELDFQLAAYNGKLGFEVFSDPTPVVTVTALSPSVFEAPSNLRAKRVDDGQIRLAWDDNATSEYGYQLFVKEGNGKWQLYPKFEPGTKFDFPIFGFASGKTYSFRVRAFKENPAVFSAYSNTLTVTTKAFQAPSELVATPSGEGAFSFKWKDRSSLEAGFELQKKTGTGEFVSLAETGSNTISTQPIPNFSLDADYQFRIRAFRTVASAKVYTAFSPVAAARSSALFKPTELAAQTLDDTSVKLTWKDVSGRESVYQVQHREVGTADFENTGSVGANSKEATISELDPGTNYEFRIRATDFASNSAFSPTVQVPTKDGITSGMNPLISLGNSFDYTVQSSTPTGLTGVTVTGLPAGLTFNPVTGKITGFAKTEGLTTVTIVANYSDGHTSTRSLKLQVDRAAPIVEQAFSPVTVAISASSTVSVTGKFSDPDTSSAARFVSSLGTFDIILFPQAAPITVDNFIDYIDGAKYDNSFIHRSPLTTSVIQGGGFRYSQAEGITEITNFGTIKNEPGLSNVRGTIAMARVGGMVNSATSQWYINTASNASLDSIDEGFTVFGRVATSGMAVVDQIRSLPIGNYTSQTGFSALNELPVNAATAADTLDPENLVKITSVGPAPLLTYQVTSNDAAIVTASLSGTEITIIGVKKGSTTIQVKATDLDGKTVTQNIAVTVP